MLLKNSARYSRKGDKLMPRWKGPYKVHADLGKGDTLYNEKTGKVLKKAVNISRLTEFHHNCPKSPEKIEQSPVSLSTDLSPENNVDCLQVVDDVLHLLRRMNNPQYPCQQIYHQKIMLTACK